MPVSSPREDGNRPATEPSGRRRAGPPPEAEDVHLRNYDDRAHEVDLWIAGEGTTIDKRYRLEPRETASEIEVLDAGRYRVLATVDGDRRASATCEVADETILIELGNGIASVSTTRY